MDSNLTHMLVNLYNSRWIDEFNSEAFVLPDGDNTVVQDTKAIESMEFQDQILMAVALVDENQDIKGYSFYAQWIQPIETWLNLLLSKAPKQHI